MARMSLHRLLALAALSTMCQAVRYFKQPTCVTDCDASHMCQGKCAEAWDACPAGLRQISSKMEVSTTDCEWTECGGTCPRDRKEVDTSHKCFPPWKSQKKCCSQRLQVVCCEEVACFQYFETCEVAQQLHLSDASASTIYNTTLAHSATALFPFYSAVTVPPGTSCDAVRVWGCCTCDDGLSRPGCLVDNSATWMHTLESAVGSMVLPKGLSLTCSLAPGPRQPLQPLQPPHPPHPPPYVPPPPAEAAEVFWLGVILGAIGGVALMAVFKRPTPLHHEEGYTALPPPPQGGYRGPPPSAPPRPPRQDEWPDNLQGVSHDRLRELEQRAQGQADAARLVLEQRAAAAAAAQAEAAHAAAAHAEAVAQEAAAIAREARICTVCMDQESDTAMMPCGHSKYCQGCALRVQQTAQINGSPFTCPVCRQAVIGTMRIHS